MKKAEIRVHDKIAGWLSQDEDGYHFIYDPVYRESSGADSVSLTLPIQVAPFDSNILFPFFDGLIPEGWLLDIAERNWKLNARDRMGLLLSCCKDCIGAISVIEVKMEDKE